MISVWLAWKCGLNPTILGNLAVISHRAIFIALFHVRSLIAQLKRKREWPSIKKSKFFSCLWLWRDSVSFVIEMIKRAVEFPEQVCVHFSSHILNTWKRQSTVPTAGLTVAKRAGSSEICDSKWCRSTGWMTSSERRSPTLLQALPFPIYSVNKISIGWNSRSKTRETLFP